MQSRKGKGAYGRTTEYALRGLGRLAGDVISLQISRERGRWMDGREGILWGSMGGWIGGWFWITRSVDRWMGIGLVGGGLRFGCLRVGFLEWIALEWG